MSYKVYSGRFLAGHGYPVLIITKPVKEDIKQVSECHSFFSGNVSSYTLSRCVYNLEDHDLLDENILIDTAMKNGETAIFNHLAEVSNVQYQAMLAGCGYDLKEEKTEFLTGLHLRNLLSFEVEKSIVKNSKNSALKEYMKKLANLGRITTEKII